MSYILCETIGPVIDQDFVVFRLGKGDWREVGEWRWSPWETALDYVVADAAVLKLDFSAPDYVTTEVSGFSLEDPKIVSLFK
jgi:hypothetical protein